MQGKTIDRIRQWAEQIWELAGRPEGQHEEHWTQAEAEIAASVAYGLEPDPRDADPDADLPAGAPGSAQQPTPDVDLHDLSQNITSKTQA